MEEGLSALRRIADGTAIEYTVEALVVLVGAPRLRANGIHPPQTPNSPNEPELALYAAVAEEHPQDAHSRYNGLIRRLVSFERALEQRTERSPASRAPAAPVAAAVRGVGLRP